MSAVIAERILFGTVEGAETSIKVTVCQPVPSPDGSDWICEVTFAGLGRIPALENFQGHGVDALQALILTLGGIGRVLDNAGIEWSMFSAQDEIGLEHLRDDGFPRPEFLFSFLGSAFRRSMQVLLSEEHLKALASVREP